jgi:hypothetical protein
MSLPVRGFGRVLANGVKATAAQIHLYSNDADVTDPALERADLREPQVASYAPRPVSAKDWWLTGEHDTECREVKWWFRGADAVVYGYFVTDALGEVLWAQRAEDAPWLIKAGDHVGVSARIAPGK